MIYKLLGPYINRRLHANVYRPQTFGDLSFAFTGPDGHAYYTWQDLGDVPAARMRNVEILMRQAHEGMSRGDLTAIMQQIKTNALKEVAGAKSEQQRTDGIARIVALAEEGLRRSDGIVPEDIFYDLAATLAIREDEEPGRIDRIVHVEKYNMMQQAGRAGEAFFSRLPPLTALAELSLTSTDGFARLLSNWAMRREKIAARMQVVNSLRGSESTVRTSTS